MILNRQFEEEHDGKGTIKMHVTYDVGTAAAIAKEVSETTGGRVGSGSSEMRVMGYIPPEMWGFDPWLIMAKRAQKAGDMGEYTKYVKKFFEIHTRFAVITPKKYF